MSVDVATSPNTYIDRFGSWLGALARSGALDGISFEQFRRLVANSSCHATDEELLQTLRDAHMWVRTHRPGKPLMRKTVDEARVAFLRRNWEAKTFAAVPSTNTIVTRFGSLPIAMLTAGVIDEQEAARRLARRGRKMPLSSLAAHVRACAEHYRVEHLRDLGERDYRNWRDALVAAVGEAVPHSITIIERFGDNGWAAALDAVKGQAFDENEFTELCAKYEVALADHSAAVAPRGGER